MTRWVCPRCDREFGRTHQAHVCVPGSTVDESFAGRPAYQREIYQRIVADLTELGPYHADAMSVGVFLKHRRTFVEVRPKACSLNLELVLPESVEDDRVARRLPISAGRVVHTIKLTDPGQYDHQVREWLALAYHSTGI
ncbi:MAG: DUF5655 domain-containing protein [Micromonosporaceae bacterium]